MREGDVREGLCPQTQTWPCIEGPMQVSREVRRGGEEPPRGSRVQKPWQVQQTAGRLDGQRQGEERLWEGERSQGRGWEGKGVPAMEKLGL